MSRLQLILAYDGRAFAGWQSQTGGDAVQDKVEQALAGVLHATVRVHGAGRTDAGVHALAQSAHVDVPNRRLTSNEWLGALNAALPATIRVMRSRYVPATFHARFSARGKVYRYRLWRDRVLPPLEYGLAWHVPSGFDLSIIEREAKQFVGRHDFSAFAANRGHPERDTIRTIDWVRVRGAGKCVAIEISGSGFLYKMVRLMVGALVRVARGQSAEGEIARRLLQPGETTSAARNAAPAVGLFLVRVRY